VVMWLPVLSRVVCVGVCWCVLVYVLYFCFGALVPLFLLHNTMIRRSPVCLRKKTISSLQNNCHQENCPDLVRYLDDECVPRAVRFFFVAITSELSKPSQDFLD
jgi:hypothetical protein